MTWPILILTTFGGAVLWRVTDRWQWIVTLLLATLLGMYGYTLHAIKQLPVAKRPVLQTRSEDVLSWLGASAAVAGLIAWMWTSQWWLMAIGVVTSVAMWFTLFRAQDHRHQGRWRLLEPLLHEAAGLAERGQFDESIATYDQVVAQFGTDLELEIRENVAHALARKASILADQDRHAEAVLACDQILIRFGEDTRPQMRVRLARALYNKGCYLDEQGRFDDSEAAFADVIAVFGTDPEDDTRDLCDYAVAAQRNAQDRQ